MATYTMNAYPNIIWIFGDQHRAQAMGHAGDPNARTPNLDKMALNGASFINAISGCPWCTPFRGSLLTGQYNHKCLSKTPQALNPEMPLITDALKAAGYETAYFGKWHLDGHNGMTYVPRERRGRFDTWIGYENNNAQYDCYVHGHDTNGRDDTEPLAEKLEGYETDMLTDYLLRYARPNKEKPFFAVLSVQPPHDPHVAPPEYMERYSPESLTLRPNVPQIARIVERARGDLAGYYAQIENLDYNVGRVFRHLKKQGLSKNTWVFYFSDHGDMHGSHGYFRKSSPWEEAVRIPFIVQGPDGAVVPQEVKAPMNHVDIAPTTLGLCGIEAPDTMQGTDWSHTLLPDKQAPDNLPESAFMQQVYRKRFDCLNRTWRGVRTVDGWKYICLEHQPFGLFNLNEDPYELNNLAFLDNHNAERERLQALLAKWIELTDDTFSLPKD